MVSKLYDNKISYDISFHKRNENKLIVIQWSNDEKERLFECINLVSLFILQSSAKQIL